MARCVCTYLSNENDDTTCIYLHMSASDVLVFGNCRWVVWRGGICIHTRVDECVYARINVVTARPQLQNILPFHSRDFRRLESISAQPELR